MSFLTDKPWYKSLIATDQHARSQQSMQESEQFPTIVSYERAKNMLEELCDALGRDSPSYSVISHTDPEGTIATVTIEDVETTDAYEFKNAQWYAARAMYEKLTGEEVSPRQAKKALAKLCRQRHYPEPVYASFPGHFEVGVSVGDLHCEASSYKSLERAEKEAAKEMYARLHRELDNGQYDEEWPESSEAESN